MARPDPLAARGVPRHGGRRSRRLGLRVGGALALILVASGSAFPRAGASQSGELAELWREEYAFLAEALADPDPETRALAVEDLIAFQQRIGRETNAVALVFHYRSLELGRDPALVPELDARLGYLRDAARAAAFQGSADAALQCYDEMGRQLVAAGRLDEAREVLTEGLDDHGEASQMGPVARLSMAEVNRRLGRWQEGLDLLAELADELPFDDRWAPFRATLAAIEGQIYVDLGMPDLAADWIEERYADVTERAAGGAATPTEVLESRYQWVALAKAVGDHEAVVARVDEFLADESLYAARPRERARLLAVQGTSLLRLDARKSAEALGLERLRDAVELGLEPTFEVFARLGLAEHALEAGDLEEAAGWLSGARELVDGGGRVSPAEAADLAVMEVRWALAAQVGPAALADLRPRLEEALETLFDPWERVPRRPGGVGYLLYGRRRAILGELVRLTIHGGGTAEEALDVVLRSQGYGSRVREAFGLAPPGEAAVRAPGLGEVRAELCGPGRGLILHLPASGASHVFAIDEGVVVHAELAPGRELDAQRRAWYSHLLALLPDEDSERDWMVEQERRLAKELCAALLPAPVAERMSGWSSVSFVGGDSLGPVPFEWLPLLDEDYLGLARAVGHLPSAALGVAWSERAGTVTGEFERDVLLVGGVTPSAGVQARFPSARALSLPDELTEELAELYAGGRLLLREGAAATRAALQPELLGSTRILQTLVHGVLDQELERPAALVLAPADESDDGLFTCDDVERTRAPDVVLLTACRSGQGPTRRGDPGAADLAGAWLAAGARAVLVSHTDLTLGEAVRVSSVVHRRLVDGDSLAEAMRVARTELVGEYGETSPFRHGLLHVVGLGDRPVFSSVPSSATVDPESSFGVAWLIGAALGGLVLGFGLARRHTASDPF